MLTPVAVEASTSCVEAGVTTFRTQGARAALGVFEQKLKQRACRDDAILHLNYARTLKAVSEGGESGLGLGACRSAEVFILVQSGRSVSDSLKSLAAEGATEVLDRCTSVISTLGNDAYKQQVKRAASYGREGQRWLSAIEWRVALRLDGQRLEGHRALCKLLPSLGMQREAERRCESWRALVAEAAPSSEMMGDREVRTTEWVLTAITGGLLIGGGVAYVLAADAHSELLAAHRRAVDARGDDDLESFQDALRERAVFESKMNDLHTTSIILLAAGGAAAVAASYLWVRSEDAELSFTGRSAHFTMRW